MDATTSTTDNRTIVKTTASTTPAMTGPSVEETSAALPPPTIAVEEGELGIGSGIERGREVVVSSVAAMPVLNIHESNIEIECTLT